MPAEENVFYQIYPLGLCGAPAQNDGITVSRITKILNWIPHLKKLNVNTVYFFPFSNRIGMDTTPEIFAKLIAAWELTKIFQNFAMPCMKTVFMSCWMEYLIM